MSKGLAAYYRGNDPVAAFEEEMNSRLEELMKAPLAEERRTEILEEYTDLQLRGKSIISWYASWAKDADDFTVIEVETKREISLGPVLLTIVPDLIIEKGGERLCMEHKARSRYSPRPWSLDLQSKLYCLGTGSMGTLYNFILYRREEVTRQEVPRTEPELEDMKRILNETARRALSAEANPDHLWVPNYSPLCSCEYIELCLAESQGYDTQYLKENLFSVSETEVQETIIEE